MRNPLLLLAMLFSLAACATSTPKKAATLPVPAASPVNGAVVPNGAKPAKAAVAAPAALDYAVGDIRSQKSGEVPDAFIALLRTHLKSELTDGGRIAAPGVAGRVVEITLSDFRMRGDVAGDHVSSAIVVKDKAGHVIGESKVDSSNVLNAGSADTLARTNAEEIARFLIGAPLGR